MLCMVHLIFLLASAGLSCIMTLKVSYNPGLSYHFSLESQPFLPSSDCVLSCVSLFIRMGFCFFPQILPEMSFSFFVSCTILSDV